MEPMIDKAILKEFKSENLSSIIKYLRNAGTSIQGITKGIEKDKEEFYKTFRRISMASPSHLKSVASLLENRRAIRWIGFLQVPLSPVKVHTRNDELGFHLDCAALLEDFPYLVAFDDVRISEAEFVLESGKSLTGDIEQYLKIINITSSETPRWMEATNGDDAIAMHLYSTGRSRTTSHLSSDHRISLLPMARSLENLGSDSEYNAEARLTVQVPVFILDTKDTPPIETIYGPLSEVGKSPKPLTEKTRRKTVTITINKSKVQLTDAEEKLLRTVSSALKATSLTVKEILAESGVTNPPQFYEMFKAKYGCTPTEYRHSSIEDESSVSKSDDRPWDFAVMIDLVNHQTGMESPYANVNNASLNGAYVIPLTVNESFEFWVKIVTRQGKCPYDAVNDLLASEHRDMLNDMVLETLMPHFHGRLNLAYFHLPTRQPTYGDNTRYPSGHRFVTGNRPGS